MEAATATSVSERTQSKAKATKVVLGYQRFCRFVPVKFFAYFVLKRIDYNMLGNELTIGVVLRRYRIEDLLHKGADPIAYFVFFVRH